VINDPTRITLVVVAVAATVAALVWWLGARRMRRTWQRIDDGSRRDAIVLAQAAYRRQLHAATLWSAVVVVATAGGMAGPEGAAIGSAAFVIPAALTWRERGQASADARLMEGRARLERRALEVLSQDDLAPRRWAARLAPEELPEFEGYEVGAVYEAGTGMMAGDFYDVFSTAPGRLVAVIGDVTGHGIEPSITAFQTKYLLRVFLRQFRDPGQALFELNHQLSQLGRPEELVSLCAVVLDAESRTLRYASAGHPPVWLWHDREPRPLRATGPLLTLEATSDYGSREVPLDEGDVLVLYTDGLTEARSGDQMFGEDRVAQALRRDPSMAAPRLCRNLLDAAREFASEPLSDDVAILAVRRR
jgi:serine phosphatase RsbU (regulator of sigma subunit)